MAMRDRTVGRDSKPQTERGRVMARRDENGNRRRDRMPLEDLSAEATTITAHVSARDSQAAAHCSARRAWIPSKALAIPTLASLIALGGCAHGASKPLPEAVRAQLGTVAIIPANFPPMT